jgi:hypothetical protein
VDPGLWEILSRGRMWISLSMAKNRFNAPLESVPFSIRSSRFRIISIWWILLPWSGLSSVSTLSTWANQFTAGNPSRIKLATS